MWWKRGYILLYPTHKNRGEKKKKSKQQTKTLYNHPEHDSQVRSTDVVINKRAGWPNIVHGFRKKGYNTYTTNTTTATTTYPRPVISGVRLGLTSKERCAHSTMVGYYMHPIYPQCLLIQHGLSPSFASEFDVDKHLHNKLRPPHNWVIL